VNVLFLIRIKDFGSTPKTDCPTPASPTAFVVSCNNLKPSPPKALSLPPPISDNISVLIATILSSVVLAAIVVDPNKNSIGTNDVVSSAGIIVVGSTTVEEAKGFSLPGGNM
jgi:hypothetical protein